MSQKKPSLSATRSLIALLVLLVLAFTARSWVAYDYVFAQPDTTRLLGVDPFFHLRQSHYILNHYPHIQRHDDGTHFPVGLSSNANATGLFDIAIATVALVIYGADATINEVAAVAAWFVPVLSLLSGVSLYLLGKVLIGRSAGLVALCGFFLFPGQELDRSILGFADHHSAEAFLAIAIALGLVYLFKQERQSSPTSLPAWRQHQQWQHAFLAASPLIVLTYTWKGAALSFAVIGPALLLYWTIALAAGEQPQRLARASIRYGLALLICFGIVHFGWPELELYPRGMRWLLFGAIGLTVGSWLYLSLMAQLLNRWPKSSALKNTAIPWAGFLAVTTITLVILNTTTMGQKIIEVLLGSRTPMIREQSEVTAELFFYRSGSIGLLAILGFIAGLVMALKRQIATETIIPLTMGLIWTIIWCSTGDFGYTPPAFLAFCAMIALYKGYRWTSTLRPVLAVCALFTTTALLITPIYPLKISATPWVDKVKLSSIIIYEDAWYEALEWLRQHSPTPARTPLSPVMKPGQPDYGIMASWDFGNIIASHGDRIPIWSRYASGPVPKWTLAQSEAQSLQRLCPKCQDGQAIRYAIVDAKTYGPFFNAKAQKTGRTLQASQDGVFNAKGKTIPRISFGPIHHNSMVAKLYAKDGLELSHYRLVYESPAQHYHASFLQMQADGQTFNYRLHALPIETSAQRQQYQQWVKGDLVITDDGYLYDDQIQASIKIYEVVPGATISGQTQADALVQLRLNLHISSSGRDFVYTRTTRADSQGQYQLTVPYATSGEDKFTAVYARQPYQRFVQLPGQQDFVYQDDVMVASVAD